MKDPKKIIAQQSTQLDKTSWNRKYENLQKLIAQVNDFADQIMVIENQKLPYVDEINTLRAQMVQECIHPVEFLIEKDDIVECKFCNKRIKVS